MLPVISGSGINTFLTMNGLKHKYQMEMACAPGEGLNTLVEKNDMKVHRIKNFVSEARLFKDIHALWQLYRLLRREKFDLMHTHNSKGGFIGRFAARLAGGPPVVHTVHGFAFHENETWLRRNLFLMLEKMAKNWCSKIICISQPLVELWVKHKLASLEKITKIYSGIHILEFKQASSQREKIREQLGISKDEIIIGQVSKLWEGKGHEDIIEASSEIFAKVENCRIFFVGDGDIRPKLERKIREKGLTEKIILLGHRDDVPEITSALDIAVLASHFEGMGRVILEAMAAGLPVAATRVGGIVDLVDEGKTGFLFESHRPDQLAQAIIKLGGDPLLREQMGKDGQKRVDVKFSAETMISQIDNVYEEVFS